MKIEIGESLIYSWLRHEKQCQIVQTNWKTSPNWQIDGSKKEKLKELMEKANKLFIDGKDYTANTFKNNASIDQVIRQGECDVIGIQVKDAKPNITAIDVAFHENGLNYGSRQETVMKVITKSLRTAMCVYGFMGVETADIIFASPKVNNAVLNDLNAKLDIARKFFKDNRLEFSLQLIVNDSFNEKILSKITGYSREIADTTELFLRSYQLCEMFDVNKRKLNRKRSI